MLYCIKCDFTNERLTKICAKCGSSLEGAPVDTYCGKEVIVGQRYRMISPLKVGGMAGVYVAKDTRLNSICAIKELHMQNFADTGKEYSIQNFKAEAELLANLRHPSLPRVIDYFYENSKYYLVMDYIYGDDLSIILEREGIPWLPEKVVLNWAIELCDVLVYLHNQSPPIIYRDLKPSNIMLKLQDKKVMLIDFGLAQMVYTRPLGQEVAFGTAGYAPPEQYAGREEPRSDIYSLGATIHHLITGTAPNIPFKFKPVREINREVSPEFERIVKKSVEKNINSRYQTALLMKDDLMSLKEDYEMPDELENNPDDSKLLKKKLGISRNVITEDMAGRDKISVFVVEDDKPLRKMMKMYVSLCEDMCVIGEATNGKEAIEKFRSFSHIPDITLMDISMPEVDGIEATREIIKLAPFAKIIILTALQCRREIVLDAFKAGATGYMLKDTADMDNISDAIRKAHKGGAPIEPAVASILIDEVTGQKEKGAKLQDEKSPLNAAGEINKVITSPDNIFKFDLSVRIQSINFNREERQILPHLNGYKNLKQISDETGMPQTELFKMVYHLYNVGILKKV